MKYLLWLPLLLLPAIGYAQETPAPQPSPYDSARYSWRRPLPRRLLRELQPDRPGVTESPFTVDAGHVQLAMDVFRRRRQRDYGQPDQTRTWQLATSLLKLGLSRRTDLQLELPLYADVKQYPGYVQSWQPLHEGFGDVALRLKHNFLGDLQDGSLALAATGYVRLPTGGALGSGSVEYGLVLPIDIELSENANLEAQLETAGEYDRETARRYLSLLPSAALEYDFTPRLGLVTELAGQWNTQQRRWQASVNVAPIFQLTDNLQLDTGVHLPISRRADHEFFVGFALRR